MTKADKPKIEELAEGQAFWNTYRELRLAKGINVDQVFVEWAEEQAQRLTSPGAREDFVELCKDGCTPQVLAAIVALLRHSPRLETFWQMMVGPLENRRKTVQALEKAAATLEEVFGDLIATEDEEQRATFTKIGRIPFSRMVSELRFYVRFINLAESLRKDTESHSLREVSKYLLASYVKRTTGRFHDRNVSGLTGEVISSVGYDEIAQRMWRSRNYMRLDKHFSWMTDFLAAMSVVITHPA